MKRRRVKITGIGPVTPAGIGREAFWKGILEPVSRVSVIKRFPEDAGPFVAAEVKRFKVEDYVENGNGRRQPRHTQFALAAAKLALADAGIPIQEVHRYSPVVVTGTSLMDSDVINRTIENVTRKGARFGLSRVVYNGPVSSIATAVAEKIGGARTLTLQSACCAGSDAIGHAAALIADGSCDLAICGGTEAPIYYHPMLELKMAGLSPDTADRPEQLGRPFDMWRTTGVIGEGACLLVLEPESSPRRGYAYVSGYSYATDAAKTPGGGWLEAVRLCMANANARAAEVDLISAWGPGHREIDAIEARMLRIFFGDALDEIPTLSIKGAIGNPFAAAGAIQVGCAALGMRESAVPPTVNWQHADPACRLNLSAGVRFIPTNTALISSHGLSGTNSCLLLRKCS
jgi:3-oxoacyl-(acyl-carrier-protein) synthase